MSQRIPKFFILDTYLMSQLVSGHSMPDNQYYRVERQARRVASLNKNVYQISRLIYDFKI